MFAVKTRYFYAIITIFIVVALGFGYALKKRVEHRSSAIPVLSVYLGEDVHQVRDSLPSVLLDKGWRSSVLVFMQPVILNYSEPNYSFKLPSTLYLYIKVENNKVEQITLAPQTKTLELEDAIVLTKKIIKIIDDA